MAPQTAPVHNIISSLSGIPAGVAGDVTRSLQSTKDTVFFDKDTATPDAYGIPLVMVANKVRKFADGNDGTDIKGALVRSAPERTELDGSPNVDAPHGRILRGSFLAVCAIGTPAREGVVYVRTVADIGKEIGDLEATEAAGENVAVPNWVWNIEGKDANDVGEIRIGA